MSLRDYGILPNSDIYSEQLGFADYQDYLRSPLWDAIRDRVFTRDSGTCVRCNTIATHVHHRSYTLKVMRGDDDSNLVALCSECHYEIHFYEDGSKRSDSEWERILVQSYAARSVGDCTVVGGRSFKVVRIVSRRRH